MAALIRREPLWRTVAREGLDLGSLVVLTGLRRTTLIVALGVIALAAIGVGIYQAVCHPTLASQVHLRQIYSGR